MTFGDQCNSCNLCLARVCDRRGLISHGVSLADATREAGIYAGRILNGNKPVDLPVMQPGKLELVINLRSANEQRINIREKLLVRADEVVE